MRRPHLAVMSDWRANVIEALIVGASEADHTGKPVTLDCVFMGCRITINPPPKPDPYARWEGRQIG